CWFRGEDATALCLGRMTREPRRLKPLSRRAGTAALKRCATQNTLATTFSHYRFLARLAFRCEWLGIRRGWGVAQAQRLLVVYVLLLHRAVLVPEMQDAGDHDADDKADQEEDQDEKSIGRRAVEQYNDDCNCYHQRASAAEKAFRLLWLGIPEHE